MAEITINGKVFKIGCVMHDCENNLHSFRSNKRLQAKGIEKGCCFACKSSLVDWERIYKRNISDIDYLMSAEQSLYFSEAGLQTKETQETQ
jgi:hypothetical protein